MSDAAKPSLLSRFRAPLEPVPDAPPASTAVVRAEPATLAPAKPKTKPLSWQRLSKLVSKMTGGFEVVLEAAADIANNPDVEPRDRLKAFEFLAKWTEPNPAMTKREVTVSGPDGKPIAVAHAHKHLVQVALPDLSKLSDAELEEYERLQAKLAGAAGAAPQLAGRAVDVEVE